MHFKLSKNRLFSKQVNTRRKKCFISAANLLKRTLPNNWAFLDAKFPLVKSIEFLLHSMFFMFQLPCNKSVNSLTIFVRLSKNSSVHPENVLLNYINKIVVVEKNTCTLYLNSESHFNFVAASLSSVLVDSAVQHCILQREKVNE